MKSIDIILIVIVAICVFIGFKSTRKHMKGQGGCCGEGDVIIEPDKKLEEPVLGSMEFKVEGMTCENCANRIKRALNRIDGVSAQVMLRRKKARIQYSKLVEKDEIIRTIENLGYVVK